MWASLPGVPDQIRRQNRALNRGLSVPRSVRLARLHAAILQRTSIGGTAIVFGENGFTVNLILFASQALTSSDH